MTYWIDQSFGKVFTKTTKVGKVTKIFTKVTSPLRELLQKDVHWNWEEHHKTSFENVKKLLSSGKCMAFFDVSNPILIQLDVSNFGQGAELLQE